MNRARTEPSNGASIVAPSPVDTDLGWHRPGPGSWVLDLDHTGPTPSRPVRDLFEEAAETGMRTAFEILGAPLDTMQIRFVNGRFYRRMKPAVGGDRDLPAPPPLALWIGARIHPTLRRRERTARRALDERRWLDELDRWERDWRPTIVATNTTLARVDPAELSDPALADHLGELWRHLRWTTSLHFRLHGADVGPIGLLLVRTDAIGHDRGMVFDALAGASEATTEPARAFAAVRERLGAHARLTDRTLDDLRALGPDIADALDDVIGRYGWRLTTGYDLTDRCLIELPGVITTMAATMVGNGGAATPGASVQTDAVARGDLACARLLEATPADQREEIGTMLEDARRCYGLRDENGPLTYEWPAGLLRRAVLEASSRLRSRTALIGRDHAFDATIDELVALLLGGTDPDPDELARRHEVRRSWRRLDPPPTLGPPESIPPPWTLPQAMRRLTTATLAVVGLLATERASRLEGTGVGAAPYTGTARIVTDAVDAFDRVEPGDVLVTTATVPTFNAVLAVAGALVVEEGGHLSHAAVMARELGFPAVIGAADATTAIPDGARVEVDPIAGIVRVLS